MFVLLLLSEVTAVLVTIAVMDPLLHAVWGLTNNLPALEKFRGLGGLSPEFLALLSLLKSGERDLL